MYIKIKLKTKEELIAQGHLVENRLTPYGSPEYNLRSLSSIFGQDVMNHMKVYYTSFEDVPDIIKIAGREMLKEYVTWEAIEVENFYTLSNGLQKLHKI